MYVYIIDQERGQYAKYRLSKRLRRSRGLLRSPYFAYWPISRSIMNLSSSLQHIILAIHLPRRHFVNSVNFINFVTHCATRPSHAVSLLLAWRPGFIGNKLPCTDSPSLARKSFVCGRILAVNWLIKIVYSTACIVLAADSGMRPAQNQESAWTPRQPSWLGQWLWIGWSAVRVVENLVFFSWNSPKIFSMWTQKYF